MCWQDTGLRWVATSPNVPRVTSAFGYSAVGVFGELAGGSGITIGTGFQRPFECIAATWLDAGALSRALNAYGLPGLRFEPFRTQFRDQAYQGVELTFTDPNAAPLYAVNFHLLDAIRQVAGRDLCAEAIRAGKNFTMFDKVNGTDRTRLALAAGRPASEIVRSWQADEERFRAQRRPYLLYPETKAPSPNTTKASRQVPASSGPVPRPSAAPAAATPSGRAAAATVPTNYFLITIRRGDTLQKIAEDLKVSISDIVDANPGLDAGKIRVGQQIKVPKTPR
jgi:hypothetical protein